MPPILPDTINIAQEQGIMILSNPLFLLLILIIVLVVIALLFLRYYLQQTTAMSAFFQKAVLLIRLPRETTEKEEKKEIKEILASMENFFDNIGGLKSEKGLHTFLFGKRSDIFSFEIVSDKEGAISFYVVVPQKVKQFFEQQIHAQYPSAHIDIVNDYNIFVSQGVVKSAYLKLKKYSMFPIKTYMKRETDLLSAVTNSLSKIAQDDAAAIQILARPTKANWRHMGTRVAHEMQQGKELKQAIKTASGGFLKIISGFLSPGLGKKQDQEKNISHQLSPSEQEIVKLLDEKASKAGMEVNINIVVSANNEEKANEYLENIINAFSQYTEYENANGFKSVYTKPSHIARNFIYRIFDKGKKFILNSEELTSIFHFPLSTTETPNINWLTAKSSAAPVNIPEQGLILGRNIYRGEEKIIRLKNSDRRRHVYMIGKTGTGKSNLITQMAIQDIVNGDGTCVIDPHGDLIESILQHVPKERAEDVIYFDPGDLERPMGLNLLEYDPDYPEQKTFFINEMINIMDKLYDLRQTGGPMFEQYMRNALLLIMEHPESGATLMEISKVLANPDFRKFKLDHCANQVVNDFWTKEAEKAGGEVALSNVTPYITSKLNQFIANDIMRPIIGQQKSAFNFREIMDEQKILLINLSKGRIGDLNASLLGLVLVGKILAAALSRTDIEEKERKDFYLYIDEFQNFITESINTILAEARKYRLCLTIANQYIGQLVKNQDTSVRDAVFGTVGTLISFKVGVEDAEFLEKEFAPVFNLHDLVNVEKFNAYIKLLVDNQSLRPFNVLPYPPKKGSVETSKIVKELSRLKYGRAREEVEREILERGKKIYSKIESE